MSSLLQFISHVSLLTQSYLICLYYSHTMEAKHTLWIYFLKKAAEFAFFLVCNSFVYTPQSSHGESISTNCFAPAKGLRFSFLLHFTSHYHQQTSAAEKVETDVHRVPRSKMLNPQLFRPLVIVCMKAEHGRTWSVLSLQMGLTASDITVWLSVWRGGLNICSSLDFVLAEGSCRRHASRRPHVPHHPPLMIGGFIRSPQCFHVHSFVCALVRH